MDEVDAMIELAITSAPSKKNIMRGPKVNAILEDNIVAAINWISMVTKTNSKDVVSAAILLYGAMSERDDLVSELKRTIPPSKREMLFRKNYVISPEAKQILIDNNDMKSSDIVIEGMVLMYSMMFDKETAGKVLDSYPQFGNILRRPVSA
ncbi:MAG: hypothetical protein IJT54_06625 [Candidatus Methanomethylophilaceae archaeon]|nr:hypothetical protein [Candidatus Methanomethylophilaceae archaeon]